MIVFFCQGAGRAVQISFFSGRKEAGPGKGKPDMMKTTLTTPIPLVPCPFLFEIWFFMVLFFSPFYNYLPSFEPSSSWTISRPFRALVWFLIIWGKQ